MVVTSKKKKRFLVMFMSNFAKKVGKEVNPPIPTPMDNTATFQSVQTGFLSTHCGRVFAPRGLAHENFIRTRQESVAFGHNTRKREDVQYHHGRTGKGICVG